MGLASEAIPGFWQVIMCCVEVTSSLQSLPRGHACSSGRFVRCAAGRSPLKYLVEAEANLLSYQISVMPMWECMGKVCESS